MDYLALEHTVRTITLVSLGIAGGLMFRYYLTRPQMPKTAFLAFTFWLIALVSEIAVDFNETAFNWFQTPLALAGALCVMIGAASHLRWRGSRRQ